MRTGWKKSARRLPSGESWAGSAPAPAKRSATGPKWTARRWPSGTSSVTLRTGFGDEAAGYHGDPQKGGGRGRGPSRADRGLLSSRLRVQGYPFMTRNRLPAAFCAGPCRNSAFPGKCWTGTWRFLPAMGVEFHGNRTLGKDLDLEKLEKEYDAVLLAVGCYGQPA